MRQPFALAGEPVAMGITVDSNPNPHPNLNPDHNPKPNPNPKPKPKPRPNANLIPTLTRHPGGRRRRALGP